MSTATIQQLEQHIAMLRQAPAPSPELVDALNELAGAYTPVNLQKGIDAAQSAATLARFLRYPQGEADSLISLCWLLIRDSQIDAAFLQAQHALYIAQQLGDASRQAKSMHLLAVVHHEAGNYVKAEALWLELLTQARQEGDRNREADYLTALGILRQEQADLSQAYEFKRQAHEIYVDLNDAHLVISLNNLAYLLTKMGTHDQALSMATEALKRCPPEFKSWRSTILDTLGLIHHHQRNHQEARRLLNESIYIALGSSINRQQAIRSLINLSKVEWECNNRPAAIECLWRALTLAEEIKSVKLQAQIHQSLYRFYLHMKAYDAASQHHEQYLARDHEMGCKRMEKQVQIMRANAALINLRPEWMRESRTWLQAA